MAEVYRARDTRLKRDVALKILPESVAADPERIARFEREAELLATLNHPHIANIYGVEEEHGTRAIVMEFVEGETLAARIAAHPSGLPIVEAVSIVRQITEALQAAYFDPTGEAFKLSDVLFVAAWGILGLVLAIRFFSWEPRR